MTDKEKLEKLKKFADAMYYAATYLTTDASRLHKAMDEYHQFIIHECKEEPVSIWHDGCEIPESETNILMIRKDEKDSNYHPIAGCFHGLNSRIDGKNWGYYNGFCYNEIEAPCKWAYIDDFLALEEIPPKFPLFSQKKCMYTKDDFTDEDRKVLCEDCDEKCEYSKKEESVSEECIYNRTLEERQRSCKFCSAACQVRIKEESVSEDLEEALAREWHGYNDRGAATVDALEDNTQELTFAKGFYLGAQWQKANLWKPADGDDLPEYDKEVIVLIKYKEYPTYRVGFGHRPNPDGWDGKNIDTNEVTHYTPKLYNKGGWNAPDIIYWLDVELPKEIEL